MKGCGGVGGVGAVAIAGYGRICFNFMVTFSPSLVQSGFGVAYNKSTDSVNHKMTETKENMCL